MRVHKTELPGVLVVEPERHVDLRGSFSEIFQAERYAEAGITAAFVQDNFSRSTRGVLRGLHLQHPNSQAKLVTVLRGCVLDVAIDVRRGSPTFGRHVAAELSDQNGRQLFLPRGFAHGFVVLSDHADVFYKIDSPHRAASEVAIRWNDPALAIDWTVSNPILSPRDETAPSLADCEPRLPLYGPC